MPKRCGWVKMNNPLYVAYHDEEWGWPLHDDQALFELLCMETYLQVQEEFGSFDAYLWSFVDGKTIVNDVPDYRQAPAKTALSEKLAKDLKKRGFKFTGPVAVLSYLQAAGLVNDHENDCDWKNFNH